MIVEMWCPECLTEHVHEWSFMADDGVYSPEGSYGAYCECEEELTPDEVERRLNATERLSAKAATREATEHDCMSDGFRVSLFDYAAALEETP